ncbi:hypothetical protein QTG54_005623 [Skeletonema marinoi]|uniref:Uncharacterized protein n=1 Tax=Skeletonema marinoi TaxID=267567 RepID=A0AAD9DDX0_9STRA|nr:hypothetical protein QTG54_005623 [Skeletonema marinoi]
MTMGMSVKRGKEGCTRRRLEAKYGVGAAVMRGSNGAKDDDEAAEDLDGECEEDEMNGEEL